MLPETLFVSMITTNLKRGRAALAAASIFTLPSLYADPLKGAIEVDATQSLGPVNKLIFGHNVEAADTDGIFGKTQRDKIYQGDGFWLPLQGKPSRNLIQKSKEIGMRMLRYPGGCYAHNYDWRKSVGPRTERGDWQFGLDEYLLVCKEIGAEPMITISDYVLPAEEMPKHAAELVEYLNMPATPEYPWAMKRKEWGNPEPYGVIWFELGNESNHGNHDVHPRRQFSPDGYARYANATMAAMRAVDPTIKIGVVSEAGGAPESQWNRVVFREAGKNADFIVVHHYPGGIGRPPKAEEEELSYVAGLSFSDQTRDIFARYRQVIRDECGRLLPMANTEFNNNMKGDEPKAFRYTLAGGLIAADAIRIFLEPETGLATANFWQMFYGYYGPVRVDLKSAGAEGDYKTTDLGGFKLFRLWGQHFGDELVQVTVDSPKADSPGLGTLPAAQGAEKRPSRLIEEISLQSIKLDAFTRPGAIASISADGVLAIDLEEFTGNFYPEIIHVPRPKAVGSEGCDYELDYEARFLAEPGSEEASLCLGMGDSRGWAATKSAVAVTGVDGPRWREIAGSIRTLPEAPGVNLIVRLEPGAKPVSGRLEIRNIRLRAVSKPVFPAFDLLTASASLSLDRSKLYLIVFNKSPDRIILTDISLKGFKPVSAKRWEVNGPSLGSVDGVEEVLSGVPVNIKAADFRLGFPAHSMTALEFDSKEKSVVTQ
jgi:alpha-N-arabinofuranosidase